MSNRADVPPFVGRDHALEALGDALAAGRLTGAVALVRARAGAGKSRLVHEAIERCVGPGTLVLRATASPLQSDVPFAVTRTLLRRLDHDGPAATAGAVAGVVERRALDGPVVVVADDLQWADESSLLVLEKLAYATHDLPLALVCVTRPAPVPAGLLRLERAMEQAPRSTVLDLDPLPDEALLELATEMLDATPPADVVELLRSTGGNALHATTVLRQLAAGGATDSSTAHREGVLAAVRRHLHELPTDAIEVLQWAATLGVRFAVDDLVLVTGLSTAEVAAPLGRAVELGVVTEDDEGLRFTHALIREALHDQELEPARRARHGHVLATLAAAGAPPERWAGHLDQAVLTEVPDAHELLRRAAASPLPVPAHRRAMWLAQARTLHPDACPDLLLELLEARRHARDVTGHTQLLAELRGRLDELEPAQLTRLGLAAAVSAEDRHATLPLIHELVAAGADEGAQLLARLLEAERQGTAARTAAAEAVLASRVASEHPDLRARAAFVLTLDEADEDRLVDLVQEVVGATRGRLPLEAGLPAVLALASAPRTMQRAVPLVDEALDLAVQLDSAVAPVLRAARFRLHVEHGDWMVAFDDDWRDIVQAATATSSRDWFTFSAPFAAVGPLLERGAVDDARWTVERLEAHVLASGDLLSEEMRDRAGLLAEQGRALLSLQAGDVDDAQRRLRRIAGIGDWDLAALAHLAGAPDIAAAVADHAEQRAATTPNGRNARNARWARALADRRPDLLGDETSPLPYEMDPRFVEWLHLDEVLGDLHTERGDVDEGVRLLEAARSWLEHRGAVVGAARVRDKLRQLGVAPQPSTGPSSATHGWEAITPAEWRTLDLIERDLLYREAAERLFLSRRTVESHVQSARRKLDAQDRRALTTLLREGEGATRLAAWRADPT